MSNAKSSNAKSSNAKSSDVESIVRLEGVSRVFNKGKENAVRAVDNVSMSVEKGCFAAVTGPSGSGKSSLLNLIGTLDTPDEGTIKIMGEKIHYNNVAVLNDFRIRYLGFVFQTFNLIPVLTALENVTMPLWVTSVSASQTRKMGEMMLEKVGLKDRMNHRPGALSGGQQQRVSIARALVRNPTLVLADEPTANLDTKSAFQIIELMQNLHANEGAAFLFSTHDDRLLKQCPDVRHLVDGRWVHEKL